VQRRSILKQIQLPLYGLGLVLAYGIIGYVLFGYGVLDAIHRTLLVLTTVGFTPAAPPSTGEKVFTASIAALGVGVFLAALAVVGTALAEGRIGVTTRRRRMQRQIDRLSDHFIICAYGRVGRAVAREFEAQAVPFLVVDRMESLEERMNLDGVRYLVADPTSEAVLLQAGIDRARGLVSAVDSDADNVYITLTARSLKAGLFIVARASESAAADRLYRAGADRVISPYVSSGRHMALLAMTPDVRDYLDIEAAGFPALRLEEVVIDDASPMAGGPVSAACGDSTPVLLRRADGSILKNPAPDETLAAGDLLVALGEPGGAERGEAGRASTGG